MSIHAVLIIPEEGDPLKLLEEGPCGARPPMAFWWDDPVVDAWCPCDDMHDWDSSDRLALVLAWDGKVVRAGCLHLAENVKCVNDGVWGRAEGVTMASRFALEKVGSFDAAGWFRANAPGWTLVLLDKDGQER